jgi:hypothetical protein
MRVHQISLPFLAVGAAALSKRDEDECVNFYSEFASELQAMPTMAPSIAADVAGELASLTDPCEVPEFTGSVGEAYSSYLEEVESWSSENADLLESLAEACSTSAEGTATYAVTGAVCSAASTAEGDSDSETEETATDAGAPTSTAEAGSDDSNAAGRFVVAMSATLASLGAFLVAL